jgi:hypothetical protein
MFFVAISITLACVALIVGAALYVSGALISPIVGTSPSAVNVDGYVSFIQPSGGPGVVNFNVENEASHPVSEIAVTAVNPLSPASSIT